MAEARLRRSGRAAAEGLQGWHGIGVPDVLEGDGEQLMDVLVIEGVQDVASSAAVAHQPA